MASPHPIRIEADSEILLDTSSDNLKKILTAIGFAMIYGIGSTTEADFQLANIQGQIDAVTRGRKTGESLSIPCSDNNLIIRLLRSREDGSPLAVDVEKGGVISRVDNVQLIQAATNSSYISFSSEERIVTITDDGNLITQVTIDRRGAEDESTEVAIDTGANGLHPDWHRPEETTHKQDDDAQPVWKLPLQITSDEKVVTPNGFLIEVQKLAQNAEARRIQNAQKEHGWQIPK